MASSTTVPTDVEYEYSSTEAPHTDNYLTPPILQLCRALGAKKVLDLGCGNGALCGKLFQAGFEVAGLDLSESGVEQAKKALPNVDFKVMSVYDDPADLGDSGFDVVISTEVVEHLLYPRRLPQFASQVLKPGGHLIITTPYHGYLKNLLICLLGKWDSHHSPLWDGGHVKFWSKESLSRLLQEQGFSVTRFIGAGRTPFLWKSMIIVARMR